MNLHEFQSKSILKNTGFCPRRILAHTAEKQQSRGNYPDITGSDKWVIKAQVHAGGRGKGGGVKVAKSVEE